MFSRRGQSTAVRIATRVRVQLSICRALVYKDETLHAAATGSLTEQHRALTQTALRSGSLS